jgi:hypothetical protein
MIENYPILSVTRFLSVKCGFGRTLGASAHPDYVGYRRKPVPSKYLAQSIDQYKIKVLVFSMLLRY